MFFLMVLGIVLILFGVAILANTDSHIFELKIGGVIFMFLGVFFLIVSHTLSYDRGYKGGQIDALNGKQKYEIVYHYINRDTIPCDTTYVLKEEYENEQRSK